jgi:hypothetical protein
MGSKEKPGKFDCYANALPDEPMFILLARDPHGPALVRAWAYEREHQIGKGNRPDTDRAVVAEARQCADAMEKWRATNDGKWRTPKPHKVIVNGLEWTTPAETLGYDDIVMVAWDKLPAAPPLMTVTYHWSGPGDAERSGTLYPGKPPIKVENGMIFNAVSTGNA